MQSVVWHCPVLDLGQPVECFAFFVFMVFPVFLIGDADRRPPGVPEFARHTLIIISLVSDLQMFTVAPGVPQSS